MTRSQAYVAKIGHAHVQAHFIVDEMLMNGCLVETNKQNVLQPVQLLEKAAA